MACSSTAALGDGDMGSAFSGEPSSEAAGSQSSQGHCAAGWGGRGRYRRWQTREASSVHSGTATRKMTAEDNKIHSSGRSCVRSGAGVGLGATSVLGFGLGSAQTWEAAVVLRAGALEIRITMSRL